MTIITDTKARNIKPTDTAIPHGGITGLALHPSNTKGCVFHAMADTIPC